MGAGAARTDRHTRIVAAVENYINYRAQRWNFSHASQPLLDSKSNKVSFDEKIDQWLPIMTGKRLERDGREWADFLALRKLRDDRAIHSKSGARESSTRRWRTSSIGPGAD